MKNWQYFLACLALSAGIWLIHNLSHSQTDVVSVQVYARSNLAGRAARSSDAVEIAARCKASGFRLLYLERKKKAVEVAFDADDFSAEDGDYFSIASSQLYRYVNEIFGSGTSVESFLSDKVRFRFIRELNKKVPVKISSSLSFKPQYMQKGDFVIQPDSVLVYGPADLLGKIESVGTSTITRSDVRSNLHGEVALVSPAGVRLSDNAVSWSLEVSRYVQIEAELSVKGKNIPADTGFAIYPDKAMVVFNCVFPVIEDPASGASCFVDYREFVKSRTGRCMIRCENLPAGVISYSVQPEVAECVEKL